MPLTYNGRPYYNKPPLRIWLTALTFKVAGLNEWSVRLSSGIVGLIYVLVGRLSKRASVQGVARYVFVLALLGLAGYLVIEPLKLLPHRSGVHQLATATDRHLREGEILYVVLPARSGWNPRFVYYFGTKDLRRLQVEDMMSGDHSGRLELTNRANLKLAGIEVPVRFLSRMGELVLVRWPGK